MTATNLHDVLLRPVISEKSTLETERNNYTFAVARHANKFLIKAAVEARPVELRRARRLARMPLIGHRDDEIGEDAEA